MSKKHVLFRVRGKVQGVMFRQTYIRACISRGLKGAASNLSDGTVACYLSGDSGGIDDLILNLTSGKEINSWGACVDELIPTPESEGVPFENHQVTTSNVDSFNWNPGVDMYI